MEYPSIQFSDQYYLLQWQTCILRYKIAVLYFDNTQFPK